MKILIINGSPRKDGNSSAIIEKMREIFDVNSIESEIIFPKNKISGCIACGKCNELFKCIIDDEVNIVADKLKDADGLLVVSPVYFGNCSSKIHSFLERLFESTSKSVDKSSKIFGAFAVARRAGMENAVMQMENYARMYNMIIPTSMYWHGAYGHDKGEVMNDSEGIQTAQMLAFNIVKLIYAINKLNDNYDIPKVKRAGWSNFSPNTFECPKSGEYYIDKNDNIHNEY